MGVLRVLIFDRQYTCRFDQQYQAGRPTQLKRSESTQLLLGLTYSLRTLLGRMAPARGRETAFAYQTNQYRLLFLETAIRWRLLVMLPLGKAPSLGMGSALYEGQSVTLDNALRVFYSTIFVNWIVMNPLVQPHPDRESDEKVPAPIPSSETDVDTFNSAGFRTKMNEFFALSIFA